MKKTILFILFSLFVGITQAQNIQVLNGIGLDDKSYVNFVTAELFKPLEHGKFYYFTDFKIDKDRNIIDSYSEISKYWNIGKKGFSITAQYNAGIGININPDSSLIITPVYLFGFSKEAVINDLILSLDVLYRIDAGTNLDGEKIGQGVQLTGTFLRDWDHFQISGYCDLWHTEKSKDYNWKNKQSVIIIIEPQVWWKFSKRIFLGVEGRLSNFDNEKIGLKAYSKYAMIGLKWNLE